MVILVVDELKGAVSLYDWNWLKFEWFQIINARSSGCCLDPSLLLLSKHSHQSMTLPVTLGVRTLTSIYGEHFTKHQLFTLYEMLLLSLFLSLIMQNNYILWLSINLLKLWFFHCWHVHLAHYLEGQFDRVEKLADHVPNS